MKQPGVLIRHNGEIGIVKTPHSARFVEPEVFSEPWKCEQKHEHHAFCGIDRSFYLQRTFTREDLRLDDVVLFVYREELTLSTLDARQLSRRYEETEAQWLEIGAKLDLMKAEIDRRATAASDEPAP